MNTRGFKVKISGMMPFHGSDGETEIRPENQLQAMRDMWFKKLYAGNTMATVHEVILNYSS